MANTPIFCNFHHSQTPKRENKTVKLGNQALTATQAIDGTAIVIGHWDREWRNPHEVVGTEKHLCVSLKEPAFAYIIS